MSLIEQRHHEGVLTIRLNRPESMNALSRALVDELMAALDASVHDERVRVLVIEGEGRAFCAGADLKERATMSPSEVVTFVSKLRATMEKIRKHPKITIAHITGFALGGGLEMALACDLRYAAANVKIGLTETGLGIIPGAGGTQYLARIAGLSTAKMLIYKAKPILTQEAQALGIVDVCLASESLAQRLAEDTQAMAQNAPLALQAAKMAIDMGFETSIENGLAIEKVCYDRVIPTEDRLEGLQAFKEKRKPVYRGC
jgi:enoyl-CoA hydratase/carnithine racemase